MRLGDRVGQTGGAEAGDGEQVSWTGAARGPRSHAPPRDRPNPGRMREDRVMDALEHRLHDDLTAAIRARDEVRSATLRMALTAVKNEAVSGTKARELTDADVIVVLGREAKKRRESATAYDDANRPELADARARRARRPRGLPARAARPTTSCATLVAAAVAETGADSPRARWARS